MFDRASVKYEIYQRLNKIPETRGFYTDSKCESAIQESLDYISTKMFISDEGWLKQLDYLDVPAGCKTLQVPRHMGMICDVQTLVGTTYIPLIYDAEFGSPQIAAASGEVQSPGRYRIIDNRFYFSPPIGVGQPQGLQVTFMAYPKLLRQDVDKLAQQFDRCMIWFAVYFSMSSMASTVGQFAKAWQAQQDQWEAAMQLMLDKRNMQATTIIDFEG